MKACKLQKKSRMNYFIRPTLSLAINCLLYYFRFPLLLLFLYPAMFTARKFPHYACFTNCTLDNNFTSSPNINPPLSVTPLKETPKSFLFIFPFTSKPALI
jgi:hypothetical protein